MPPSLIATADDVLESAGLLQSLIARRGRHLPQAERPKLASALGAANDTLARLYDRQVAAALHDADVALGELFDEISNIVGSPPGEGCPLPPDVAGPAWLASQCGVGCSE